MVALLKLIGIIIGWVLDKMLEEKLLTTPLGIGLEVCGGLVTFGAPDFLGFIDCYFIELGIMLFERCYLGKVIEFIFEYAENKLPKVIGGFLTWINNDNQDEGEIDLAKNLFG